MRRWLWSLWGIVVVCLGARFHDTFMLSCGFVIVFLTRNRDQP